MAHRDAEATVVAVDLRSQIEAARTMAESIDLSDRFKTIESDPRQVDLGDATFDLVVLPQLLSSFSDDEAADLLSIASSAVGGGGRVVAPDLYVGPGKTGLKETLARLTVHLATPAGRVRDLPESQLMFTTAGLTSVQFTYLAASEAGLAMIVAEKKA